MPLFDPAEHEARIAAMERLNKSLEARKPKLAWPEQDKHEERTAACRCWRVICEEVGPEASSLARQIKEAGSEAEALETWAPCKFRLRAAICDTILHLPSFVFQSGKWSRADY